jgi:hypothetical protein
MPIASAGLRCVLEATRAYEASIALADRQLKVRTPEL